jgi:hypothetical protein
MLFFKIQMHVKVALVILYLASGNKHLKVHMFHKALNEACLGLSGYRPIRRNYPLIRCTNT